MAVSVGAKRKEGGGAITYVVEGATLVCTQGSSPSQLQIPDKRGVYINDIKQANINDHVGGQNIMSFGSCSRSFLLPGCIMATSNQWVRGKMDVLVDDHDALLDSSVNFCDCGGVISITDNGHG